MISYLPELYPDELVYSWFCRLYIHGGYLTHKAALADLFEKRSCNPSKEFIGYLNTDAKKIISSVIPINKLVAEHTMFPQYARFIPSDEKLAALRLLGEGSTDPHHLLTILVRNPSSEWMRYCPLCVNADREKYSETYWHRSHQIRNVNICPKHKCHLINSSVSIRNESAFSFYPAQTTVRDADVIYSKNELEHRFTDYCAELVAAPISFQKTTPISSILYKAMKDTPYMKSTGKSRYTKRFYEDITDFYSCINLQNQITFAQIQRALLGNLAEFTTITQIAFFLGITVDELINPKISEAEIIEEQESHYMRGSTPVDWEQLDKVISSNRKFKQFNYHHDKLKEHAEVSDRLIEILGINTSSAGLVQIDKLEGLEGGKTAEINPLYCPLSYLLITDPIKNKAIINDQQNVDIDSNLIGFVDKFIIKHDKEYRHD